MGLGIWIEDVWKASKNRYLVISLSVSAAAFSALILWKKWKDEDYYPILLSSEKPGLFFKIVIKVFFLILQKNDEDEEFSFCRREKYERC